MLIQIANPQNYSASPHGILLLSTGVLLPLLGLLIMIRDQLSTPSRAYFIYTVLLSLWFLGFSGAAMSTNPGTARFWLKLGHTGIILIPATVYCLVVRVVEVFRRFRKRVVINWMLSLFFLGLCLAWHGYLGELRLYPWGYYPGYGLAGALFAIFLFSTLLSGFHILWEFYQREKRDEKVRRRFRLGIVSYCIGALSGIDLLPAFGIRVYPSGFLLLTLGVSLTTYLAWRYRFMNITTVLASGQVLSTMRDALLVIDGDGMIRLVNNAASRLFGCPANRMTWKSLSVVFGDAAFADALRRSIHKNKSRDRELTYRDDSGRSHELLLSVSPVRDRRGGVLAAVCLFREITEQKKAAREKEDLIQKLQSALDEIKTLHGILPICASCKKIRDDKGAWNRIEDYVMAHSEAEFSHGLCPECARKLYPEYFSRKKAEK